MPTFIRMWRARCCVSHRRKYLRRRRQFVSREEDKLQGKEDLSSFLSLSRSLARSCTEETARRGEEKRTIPNQSTPKPCAILVERARNSSLSLSRFPSSFSYGRSVIFGTTSQRDNPEGKKRRIYQWRIPNTTTTTTTRIISPDKIPSVLIHREKESSALLAYAREQMKQHEVKRMKDIPSLRLRLRLRTTHLSFFL